MTVRLDLHVHSKFSSRPSQWILQKIGCPESFTEPSNLYRLAKLKGMTHVTITDHNRIEGALEIAHLPDTFVSEEITTYFPATRCKIHVLALNITEMQHKDIQKVRDNVYELVDYLIASGILHIVAHPLYSVNGRLTITHFEKMLLLFKNFEMNGARNDASNDALKGILTNLTPTTIDRLANIHDIRPRIPIPWKKNITGGSDDHSALNIARTFTEIPGAKSVASALTGIYNNQAKVIRRPSSPLTFAHNLYGIAYQYYRNKFDLQRYAESDTLLNFIDHCLQPDPLKDNRKFMRKLYCFWHYRRRPRLQAHVPESLISFVRYESGRLLYDNPQLMQIAKNGTTNNGDLEKKWFEFVNQISSRITLNFARNLMNQLAGANVFNTFQTIGEAGGLYAMVAPYLIAFSYFSQDRVFGDRITTYFNSRYFRHKAAPNKENRRFVAHFNDRHTIMPQLINELKNGGADTLNRPEKIAILTCNETDGMNDHHIHNFAPVGAYAHPDSPEQKLLFPPFMEMLNYCFTGQITHIHSATPGPVGLSALGVARILKIPVYGTYHPSLDEYWPFLGEDESKNEILQRFMSWYYNQLDRIYVFTAECHDRLSQQGIGPQKIVIAPFNIDIDRLKTLRSNRPLNSLRPKETRIRLIYAGPVSRENNLPLLAEVFKILLSHKKNLHLDIIGIGSCLAELKRMLEGYPCTFYGELTTEERADIYAKGTMLVCPGTHADGGRSILEAQACGLPAAVSDHENSACFISPGQTGLLFKHNDATHLYEVLLRMIDDRALRDRMRVSARRFAVSLAIDTAFFNASALNTTPISVKESPQIAEAV